MHTQTSTAVPSTVAPTSTDAPSVNLSVPIDLLILAVELDFKHLSKEVLLFPVVSVLVGFEGVGRQAGSVRDG